MTYLFSFSQSVSRQVNHPCKSGPVITHYSGAFQPSTCTGTVGGWGGGRVQMQVLIQRLQPGPETAFLGGPPAALKRWPEAHS